MKYELCIACDHCDPSKTNDRQQVFCEINPPYVDPFNGCDEFENKALDECFKNIGKSELTDNEIIKALECCSTFGKSCKECPAFVKVDRSKCREVLTGAKDLINRQQAEIERLKEHKVLIANVEVPEDKLERLMNEKVAAIYDVADVSFLCDEHIRAAAIKEFVERLKRISRLSAAVVDGREIHRIIDNLVQEMAGDPQ